MASGVFTLKQQELAITQGAWTNQPPVSVNYLVVAGGGAGSGLAGVGGGGGAGGLLQGSIPITSGTSYTVTVGAGGADSATPGGGKGSNSVFGSITATGGGAGIEAGGANVSGNSGGSGGGGCHNSAVAGNAGGQGIAGQGNKGGKGQATNASPYRAGGGGGAATVGFDGFDGGLSAGNGGVGIASDISGIRTVYAGGGGGYGASGGGNTVASSGGAGGGGAGGLSANGSAGGGNTGGGGGGSSTTGGSGGSGIVIISYPGTTQWFTGGTVSYANGNMIHTFYSSGTLAPTAASTFVDTSYQITRSLRFNSPDGAYLSRTPASASNRKTWTFSTWVKRGKLTTSYGTLFGANGNIQVLFESTSDALVVWRQGVGNLIKSTNVYRDVSAWYHVVVVLDTTQATAANRLRAYVNGVEITYTTAASMAQNTEYDVNNTVINGVGNYASGGTEMLDGYMTEVNFIDGQALNPYSFGYYSPTTGVWSPLKFVGTYGTNGFYLNFSDNSGTTSTTLGKDYSGNGNNWTPNNFSVTAGAGNDSLVDSPTAYGTDTGAGGEVRGNYCTLNPLQKGSAITIVNGNLDVSNAAATDGKVLSTIGMSSGKWYCEATVTANTPCIGIATAAANLATSVGYDIYSWSYYGGGNKITNSSGTAYGASYTTNDVIGIAFDADAGTLTFYKNNSSQGTAYTGLTSGPYFFAFGNGSSAASYNFGQRPFAYTAPSGFKALCTQNLPTPTIGATSTTQAGKYFNTVLYTGNGTTQSITGVGFQPDWVWIKSRSNAYANQLFDAVRGVNLALFSNETTAETNLGTMTAFNADGFSVSTVSGAYAGTNGNSATFAAWNWKANGAGSSNTAGSISSTVSANTTAGFSVVTWTNPSSGTPTIGHGLGVAPTFIIVKDRTFAYNWDVGCTSIGWANRLNLNDTAAAYSPAFWNSTAPTSTVFTYAASGANSGDSMVAYCFAPVEGYSAFGSYVANGSTDGNFIYTGMAPRFVLIKCSSTAENWVIFDTARDTYNVCGKLLRPNLSDAELDSPPRIDILSNGFKVRAAGTALPNTSGATYIYMALAANPFKYSLAR